ncbi:MAG: PA-phosphatase [Pseudopedobacter saltans]|uniref:PA-phosphatase n=1 Tax=Pseudopedobacter saltans TaxID=151895 RepID=A0A2W5F3Q8_9SPHI|nr:MAG: PA-phosphatase [Pseudopedobacter saltans]
MSLGKTILAQDSLKEKFKTPFYDSLTPTSRVSMDKDYRFSVKKLIIPSVFIAYGTLSMTVGPLKTLNHSTANEVNEDHPKKTSLDNYTQYAPIAMVYGANWLGLKGKHNFKERTLLLATTGLITLALVEPTKHFVKEERPDGSNSYSFPSGHSATAFATATFQYMEYKDENKWFALAGYPLAVFTGVYRVINNKHYIGDVAAGAGIGILSAQMAYWLFPTVNKLFSKKKTSNVMVSPFYQNGTIGLGLVKVF